MSRYVILVQWTDQGIRDVTQTLDRAAQVRGLVEQMGGSMPTLLWTQGRYDLVAITEAPDDATVAAISLKIGSSGSVRTEVMRAFDAEEMGGILAKLG